MILGVVITSSVRLVGQLWAPCALLLVAITGCGAAVPGSAAPLGGEAAATTAELGRELRARQLLDGTMSFEITLRFDGPDQRYEGAMRTADAGTDATHGLVEQNGAIQPDTVVLIGPDLYGAAGHGRKVWGRASTADGLSDGFAGVLTLDALVFTRLGDVSEVLTLVGSSQRRSEDDSSMVEYRMRADYGALSDRLRQLFGGSPRAAAAEKFPIEIDLTVDSRDRLRFAHVAVPAAVGRGTALDYEFSRWGVPVPIMAPPSALVTD